MHAGAAACSASKETATTSRFSRITNRLPNSTFQACASAPAHAHCGAPAPPARNSVMVVALVSLFVGSLAGAGDGSAHRGGSPGRQDWSMVPVKIVPAAHARDVRLTGASRARTVRRERRRTLDPHNPRFGRWSLVAASGDAAVLRGDRWSRPVHAPRPLAGPVTHAGAQPQSHRLHPRGVPNTIHARAIPVRNCIRALVE